MYILPERFGGVYYPAYSIDGGVTYPAKTFRNGIKSRSGILLPYGSDQACWQTTSPAKTASLVALDCRNNKSGNDVFLWFINELNNLPSTYAHYTTFARETKHNIDRNGASVGSYPTLKHQKPFSRAISWKGRMLRAPTCWMISAAASAPSRAHSATGRPSLYPARKPAANRSPAPVASTTLRTG